MTLLDARQRQRSMGGIGFVVSRKRSPQMLENIFSKKFFLSFLFVANRLLLRPGFNKTLKAVQVYVPTTASYDDEIEEFSDELGLSSSYPIYTVMMDDFTAKSGRREEHWQIGHWRAEWQE